MSKNVNSETSVSLSFHTRHAHARMHSQEPLGWMSTLPEQFLSPQLKVTLLYMQTLFSDRFNGELYLP